MPQPHNLTEGSISGRLLLFTLPILFGNILQSLNATVNSFWIGHYLGEAAMAGSSNASIVLFLVLGAMIGASLAATILIGQYLGARRLHDGTQQVGGAPHFIVADMLEAQLEAGDIAGLQGFTQGNDEIRRR